MSYSIGEGIGDAESVLKGRRKIAELYPDAYLSDGRWHSQSLSVEDCDTIVLVVLDKGGVELRLCKDLKDVHIFPEPWTGHTSIDVLFHRVRKEKPDLYKQLLDLFPGRR